MGATVLIYNGKTLKSIADIGNRDSFRYSGKGMLYSEVKNVPVSAVECFKLSAKGVAHSSRRAQPALRQVSPYMKNAAEGWPDDDYSLKCAALGGGTVTFKAGEVLTVIYCEPVVWSDDEGPESEAYIALMNKQGKIGMFSTSEYGYNIGGTEISFNESFSGFTFMP